MLLQDRETAFTFPRPADMRRHERAPLALFGSYSLGDGIELPCRTKDVSEGGVALAAPAGGAEGERVTLHLEKIGALEGEIVRSFEGGFALALKITPGRQAQLAASLRAMWERSALSLIETPMLGEGDDDPLGAALRLDASLARGRARVSGEASARIKRNAQGEPELEFLAKAD